MCLNNHINSYFSEIGSKLANECTPGAALNDSLDEPNDIRNPFDRRPFTREEVLKICNEINIYKSASIPNIKASTQRCVHKQYRYGYDNF